MVVKTDKNVFLLYTLLDSYNLMRGSREKNKIREKTYEHFKSYKGINLTIHDYKHHSKAVAFVLTVGKPPSFDKNVKDEDLGLIKNEIRYGKNILPYLKHFYENTDFEDYYQKILPEYKKESSKLSEILKSYNLNQIINEVWQTGDGLKMVIIPMPLEARMSGVGPIVGNITYQVIGPPFNKNNLYLIIHEACHPRAKLVLRGFEDKIKSANKLFSIAKKHPKWPEHYNDWLVCFEEHLIRAVQAFFINPKIGLEGKNYIKYQLNEKGMVFIEDIVSILEKYNDSNYQMSEIVVDILDSLMEKYY